MESEKINESLRTLHAFCKGENYVGYSLYDSHNSPIPFSKLGTYGSFLVNQVVKRSPINFRPVLGVRKGINPKGYGLFLHAYSMLSRMDVIPREEARERADFFFNWLKSNPSRDYSGHCWGYNYFWPKKDGHHVPAYTPSVVVTGFVARALKRYFDIAGGEEVREVLDSASRFVLNDVHLYRGKDGYCFSYTPVKRDLTVNANLLAAEVLAYRDEVFGEQGHREYIEEVVRFTLGTQNEDGSWYYSFDYETRKPKNQIDFHQGYVVESLFRLLDYTEQRNEVISSIQKGLKFYRTNQFDEAGRALWRFPSKWPIDIHNQSQGIITFSKLNEYDADNLDFARKVAEWTITNMQGKRGNFYYQLWPMLKNKVNYLRWNQAWMLLAMTTFLSNDRNERSN